MPEVRVSTLEEDEALRLAQIEEALASVDALAPTPAHDPLLLVSRPLSPQAVARSFQRDATRRRALVLADALALLLALASLWYLAWPGRHIDEALPALAATLVLWTATNKVLGLYDRDQHLIHKSTLEEVPKLLHSVTLGTLLGFLIAPPLADVTISRTQVLVFWLVAVVCVPAFRLAARSLVRTRHQGERTVVIGSGDVASTVARKIRAHPQYGAELLGFVDDPPLGPVALEGELSHLGTLDDFELIVRDLEVERVVVAFSALSHEHLLDVIRRCKRGRVKITVVPRLFEVIGDRVELDDVEGMTLMSLHGGSRARSLLLAKRGLDVVVAAAGLLVLAPLLAVLALWIKRDSPGPVFYGQERMGRHNRPFRMWKLRTMVQGADQMQASLAHLNEVSVLFKIAEDPRVTRSGRLLRRLSFDEIPQLWNVLRGEMSLVGPRPLVPHEDLAVIGWHRARLDLTPGLTGPWQVLGRTSVPFQDMVQMDYLYVAEWSLWNDLRLLVRTLPTVLLGRGQ